MWRRGGETNPAGGKTTNKYRLHHVIDVEVRADLISERASTHDISVGGMFIDSSQEYEPGMLLELAFELSGQPLVVHARVVHCHRMVGFGVSFVELTPQERGRILRFVHTVRASREAEQLLSADD